MPRVGFTFRIAPDAVEEYRRRHQHIWPDMVNALAEHGWTDYSLFVSLDGQVFGSVRVPTSLIAALADMESDDVNQRWQEQMAELLQNGDRPDQTLQELDLVMELA